MRAKLEAMPDWAAPFFKNDPISFVRLPPHPLRGSCSWTKIGTQLLVLGSARKEADEKRWLHFSCSRPTRLPGWEDLRSMREAFIPDQLTAIQVFPPRDQYVNCNPRVLHLWACLELGGLPDFRVDGLI